MNIALDRVDLRTVGPGKVSTFFSPNFPELYDWVEGGPAKLRKLAQSPVAGKEVLSVCLITDSAYWGETQGLLYNLLREHRGVLEVFLLGLDGFSVERFAP